MVKKLARWGKIEPRPTPKGSFINDDQHKTVS